MAKGSIRKKGKKWYYRYYIRDDSGKIIQKERVGSANRRETEKLLREAMTEYELGNEVFINTDITLGEMIMVWKEEELQPGRLSNGTVMAYQGVANRIMHNSIACLKISEITSEHLQKYFNRLATGNENTNEKPLSRSYLSIFSSVLNNVFRYAIFPKRCLKENPMQYVRIHKTTDTPDLFQNPSGSVIAFPVINHNQYLEIISYLDMKKNPARLPIQIAYYTGLRIGEVCGLMWQDIDLEKQFLTVKRSMRYNNIRHRTELGATKRQRIRVVDFCDTLADILKTAKREQEKIYKRERYYRNYYVRVLEKGRDYYEMRTLPSDVSVPKSYCEIFPVCLRKDGKPEVPDTVAIMCRSVRKHVSGLEKFHFHMLRHTYTSNLLSAGAAPKEVQELLGHLDLNTTMNIYAHAARIEKKNSVSLLDKLPNTDCSFAQNMV